MIPGPLHPDLFGGATPMMLEIPGAVGFVVRLQWEQVERTEYDASVHVLARDEDEAEEIARDLAKSNGLIDVDYDARRHEELSIRATKHRATDGAPHYDPAVLEAFEQRCVNQRSD